MTANLISWVVTYLMHSTLLIVAVWLGSRWIRSAGVRDTLWKLALTGALVTATLQVAMPVRVWRAAETPALLRVETPAAAVSTPTAVGAPAAVDAPVVTKAPANVEKQAEVARNVPAPAPQRPLLPAHSGTILWSALSVLLVMRLLYGRQRLLSILADRKEIVAGRDRALLDELAGSRLVRLTETAAIQSPMAMVGWEIVIPRGIFARLSDEQRRTILAHELAHLMRRDPLWLAIAEVLKAVLFFQPLNFLVAAKMKETAEFLCDDAAVLQTGDRQALAETLAELASSVVPMPTSVAAMAEGGSNLIVRVTRVLRAHGGPDLPLRMRWRLAIALVPLAMVALFAPGVAPALAPALSAAAKPAATASTAAQAPLAAFASRAVPATKAPAAAFASSIVPAAKASMPTRARPGPAKKAGYDGTFNHFTDGELVHTYTGVEGNTKITMNAKDVAVALDGSWFRFDSAHGFFRVVYVADQGETRRVEVVPGRNLEPVARYSVGNEEHSWCSDASRLVVAAFDSKEFEEVGFDDVEPKAAAARKLSEWDATIEEEGSRDGVPLRIRLKVDSIFFDHKSGAIAFERGGSMFVEEVYGSRERSFELDGEQVHLRGDWEGTTQRERQSWLRNLVRRHTTATPQLLRSLEKLVP